MNGENVRTSTDGTEWDESDFKIPEDAPAEPEAPEPEEFDDVEMPPPEAELDDNGDYVKEPTGYREVEQENGDIVMQPYWDDDNDS